MIVDIKADEAVDDDEDYDRILAMCEEMTDVFDDYDATTEEAIRAVAILSATIIVHHPESRETAMELRDLMVRMLIGSVAAAEESGAAPWARGTIQ